MVDINNNGICDQNEIFGCTDELALNYNDEATYNDATCEYATGGQNEEDIIEEIEGCTDSLAINYNNLAFIDDGTCTYESDISEVVHGCTDQIALNYDATATEDNGSCIYESDISDDQDNQETTEEIFGCTDETALNYDSTATEDDGTCIAIISGCVDSAALNYDSLANVDDGSCLYNNSPIISGIPYDSVYVNDEYEFIPIAFDIDGDALTFEIENSPGWASFDSITGSLKGVPSDDYIGTYSNIIIKVKDIYGAYSSLNEFSIEVLAEQSASELSTNTPVYNSNRRYRIPILLIK